MGNSRIEQQYYNSKEKLLADKEICKQNRDLFKEFLSWEEYKLKRTNGLSSLDDGCYRTLYKYTHRLKNTNQWFGNKPLKDITKADIKKVYDDLEDGKIKTRFNKPVMDRHSYYSKIFKSKLFKMVNKDELAREVIEFTTERRQEVKYLTEEDFHKLINIVQKPLHKTLLWLAWDIGENINSLLQLKKADFFEQRDEISNEPEFRVNLRKEILKRSRKARGEPTIYPETYQLLKKHLTDLEMDDLVFKGMEYRAVTKWFDRLVKQEGIRSQPNGDKPTFKDLRSGMTCCLLQKGWSIDELNSRLGHKPSSSEIDKYVNFLAIDKRRPKQKVQEFEVKKLKNEIEDLRHENKLRSTTHKNQLEELKLKLELESQKNQKIVDQVLELLNSRV